MAYYTDEQLNIMRNTLKEAKNNPEDPKSKEIFKRINEGKMNFELKALGLKPVPVKKPKIDLGKALATQQESLASELPGESDFTTMGRRMNEAVGEGRAEQQRLREQREAGEITTGQEQRRRIGKSLGSAAEIVGRGVTGIGSMFLSPEQEQKVVNLTDQAGEVAGNMLKKIYEDAQNPEGKTALARKLDEIAVSGIDTFTDRYQNDQGFRDDVDAAGGVAEVLTTAFGAGPIGKATKDAAEAGVTGLTKTVDTVGPAVQSGGRALQSVYEQVPDLTPKTSGISENIVANINRINPTKRVEFKKMTGSSIEEWLVDNGYRGTRNDTLLKLAQRFEESRNDVDNALENIAGTFTHPSISNVADESLDLVKKTESSEYAKIADLARKAKGEGLTIKEINELKRFYERNVKVGYLKDMTKTSDQVQLATNRDAALRNFLFKTAEENGFENLSDINKNIQATKFALDEIAGKMEGVGGNNAMSLSDWVVFSPTSIDPTFIGGFAAKKVFSTESVRSGIARLLSAARPVSESPKADTSSIKEISSKRQKEIDLQVEKEAPFVDEIVSEIESVIEFGSKDAIDLREKGLDLTDEIFPQWVPQDMRDIKLINSVLTDLSNGIVPKTGRKSDFYKLMQERLSELVNQ